MKIIFLSGGKREKTLRYLLEKNENVVAVIVPYITKTNTRFQEVILTAIEFGIPVYPVKKETMELIIKKINFDCLVSCGFSYILPSSIISKCKYAINSHPTLLPKYRGYRSGPYVLINGEKYSGVTIHFIDEKMDKGDIILQQSFLISPFDTTKSLSRKCHDLEGPLLFKAISLLRNNTYNRIKQDETIASEYNYIRTPKDSEIDWNKSLKDLYNEIRACDPDDYPAFFYVEGQKVCLKLWRPEKPEGEDDLI